MSTAMKKYQTKAKISVLDRHMHRSIICLQQINAPLAMQVISIISMDFRMFQITDLFMHQNLLGQGYL